MAKSKGSKPNIAGGGTLAKMRRGKGQDGGGKKHGKKKVWFQAGGKGSDRGKIGSWPEGQMPEELAARMKKQG